LDQALGVSKNLVDCLLYLNFILLGITLHNNNRLFVGLLRHYLGQNRLDSLCQLRLTKLIVEFQLYYLRCWQLVWSLFWLIIWANWLQLYNWLFCLDWFLHLAFSLRILSIFLKWDLSYCVWSKGLIFNLKDVMNVLILLCWRCFLFR